MKFLESRFIKTLHESHLSKEDKTSWGIMKLGSPDEILAVQTQRSRARWLRIPFWLQFNRKSQRLPQGVIAYLEYFTSIMKDVTEHEQIYGPVPKVDHKKFLKVVRGRFQRAENEANLALQRANISPAEAKIVREQMEFEYDKFESSIAYKGNNMGIIRILNQYVVQGFKTVWVEEDTPHVTVHMVRQLHDGVQVIDFVFLVTKDGTVHLRNTTDSHYPLEFIRKLTKEVAKQYDSVVIKKEEEK